MKPVLLDPEEDMIERVFSLLHKEGADYSKNLVVFPGKRPAHYLRKVIGEREKRSFIPPVIFSIEELINYIHKRISDHKDIDTVDAVAILYRLTSNHPALHPEFRSLDRFYAFGNNLYKAFEELYIENIFPERLRALESLIDIPRKSGEQITFLSDIYREFYDELKRRKLSTRSLRYRLVAEGDYTSLFESLERIIFSGFFAFTEAERLFLKRLIQDIKISERLILLFHRGPGIEQTLESLGLKINGREDREIEPKKFSLYTAPDLHGEVKLAGDLIKKLCFFENLNLKQSFYSLINFEGRSPSKDMDIDEKTVIVLPKPETLLPLLRQAIPYLREDQYNVSMGYPLTRTPIYGFFLNLFEVVLSMDNELLYLQDYLKFMLHPYTKNIRFKGRAELNRIILHELEVLSRKGEIAPFMSLKDIEGELSRKIHKQIKDSVSAEGLGVQDIEGQLKHIHDNTIRRLLSFKDIKDFVNHCKEILLFIYRESTARLHPFFYPYMEGFIKEFEKIASSELGAQTFSEIESYFNLFKRLLSSGTFPFEGTPLRGLQILGFLETRNIKFRKIIFLDLNEGVFPDLTEDYLLPYPVRKALGLPTYQDRERLMYYYFKTLLMQAEEIHLFYINNDRSERSRFLEKILWEMEKKGKKTEERTVNYRINLSTEMPDEIKKTEEAINLLKKLSLNASSLDDYLRCGIRFYYNSVLRLKKEREGLADPDRLEIGWFVHEALKRYFEKLDGSVINSGHSEEIESIVNDLFLNKYNVVTGRLYLMKEQIKRRLKEFLEFFEKEYSDHKLISVEEEIGELMADTPVKGRIDLILKKGDHYTIFDYKTSSRNDGYRINFNKLIPEKRDTWNEAIGSLQIPLYMILYSRKNNIGPEMIDGRYILLGRFSIDRQSLYSPFKKEEKEKIDHLSRIIEALIYEIKSPDISFKPPVSLKEECPWCDYRGLCGTEWVKKYEF